MAPSGPPAAKATAKGKAEGSKEKKAKPEKKEDPADAIPKVEKPDRDKHQEKVEKVNEAVNALQAKLKELSARIAERSTGKEDFFAQKAELRKKLDERSAVINQLVEEKESIMKQMGDKREEGKSMRTELNKLKKSMSYTSEEQINERIRELDHRMVVSSMSLKEEKEILKEISELKKSRPKISHLNNMEDKVSNFDSTLPVKERLDTIKAKLNEERDAKKIVSEQYKALMDERTSQMGDMPELFEERESLNKKVTEKIKERNELRDEFRAAEREFNAYLAEVRNARADRARAERAERDVEYEKERRVRAAEKLSEQPHVAETTLIDQTVSFLQSLMPKAVENQEAAKKEVVHNTKDGEVVLAKKGAEEEYYFAPTKKAKASKAKGKKEEGSKPIKHNAETFNLFSKLKLDAPVTTDEIPALLEKLEAQRKGYEAKIKEWEEKREEMKKKILAGESVEEEEEAADEEKTE